MDSGSHGIKIKEEISTNILNNIFYLLNYWKDRFWTICSLIIYEWSFVYIFLIKIIINGSYGNSKPWMRMRIHWWVWGSITHFPSLDFGLETENILFEPIVHVCWNVMVMETIVQEINVNEKSLSWIRTFCISRDTFFAFFTPSNISTPSYFHLCCPLFLPLPVHV